MRRRRFLVLAVAAMATACSGFSPFPVGPPPLAVGEPNPGTRVSICYNGWKTSPEAAQKLGQEQCTGNTIAERIGTDYRLDDCPLMTPARATFLCKSSK